MTNLNKIIFILLTLSSLSAHTQLNPTTVLFFEPALDVMPMHYRSRMDTDSICFLDSKTNHSSILPIIRTATPTRAKGTCFRALSPGKGSAYLKVYPLTDLSIGGEIGNSGGNRFLYTGGLGAGLNFSTKKLFFTGKFMPYITESQFVRDSVQNTVNMDPGASRELFGNGYAQNELLLACRPNRFFTFMTGNGRNSFGEGYRSLILSDNAIPNPFFKIETSFSNVKYVNLYQLWKDNTVSPSSTVLDQKKFAAMHYISWNITREFNISIFETVIWQSNDSLINRGFDFSYINPIVFYRPVEYGNGSADNVLLGTNMSFKFSDDHSVYTQFILDDFLLAEIRARSRWWANKYGFQFGYKSRAFLGHSNLYFQTEFNTVRPFTFSHKHPGQSYGHLNSSVTHPVGANFFEVLNIVSYRKKDLRLTNKITYTAYGADSSAVSYGQNIFVPYTYRDGDYDHLIMQGNRKNVLNETLVLEFPLLEKTGLFGHFTYNWRMEATKNHIYNSHFFSVGIRSRIWNTYTDF